MGVAMHRFWACMLLIVATGVAGADAAPDESSRRLSTLRYGIESQVMELLSTLQTEKNTEYRQQLVNILDASTSPKLRAAILEYFGSLALSDAESRAADFVMKRDEYADSLVAAAFSYLTAIKSPMALKDAAEILKQNETRYLEAAIKMIGAVGSDDLVESLRSTYESDGASQSIKEAVVLALGTMKAATSFEFLSTVATAEDSAKTLRMYACTALGNLGDRRGVAILVKASISNDPNVRASALTALGTFDVAEARSAILEGLRDANVIPRLAACKAAGIPGNAAAIPYLEYKASFDPERAVRAASLAALAKVGGGAVDSFLVDYLGDAKNDMQYRAAAFSGLIANDAGGDKLRALFTAAQEDKDRSLFTALARATVAVDAPGARAFVLLLLADKDFSVRLGAIAWAERNKDASMLGPIQALADSDSNDAVKRRAALAVTRLRAPVTPP